MVRCAVVEELKSDLVRILSAFRDPAQLVVLLPQIALDQLDADYRRRWRLPRNHGDVLGRMCGRDPGVANWLDTAGFSNGAMILRCVRTNTAPTPSARVVSFDAIASALPADTLRITAAERASIIERRRRAVHERFAL